MTNIFIEFMEEGKNVRMKFICNQDWNEMKPTANGRYCDVCRKEVIDYTTKSVKDLKSDQDLCGRFLIEQVDYSFVKPVQAPQHIKSFGFITFLLFSVFSKNSVSQTTPVTIKTEQGENNKTGRRAHTRPIVCDTVVAASIEKDGQPDIEQPEKSPFLTTHKRYYYWSKKFPFIISTKRRRLMGKF